MAWFVKVQEQVYGPYTDAQMRSYTRDGRVMPATLISDGTAAGFKYASNFTAFSTWQSTGEMKAAVGENARPGSVPVRAPAPVRVSAPSARAQATPETLEPRRKDERAPERQSAGQIYMIMAEIRSGDMESFMARLTDFGHSERIGDTVWMLRSSTRTDKLRNALSQSLGRQDRLFILDTAAQQPAWFNIGADLDYRIRQMWDMEELNR